MPSASPNMKIMLTIKNCSGKTFASNVARLIESMIARIASRIGMKAATTAPKTKTNTSMAMGIAISSASKSSMASSLKVWLKLPKPNVATVKPPSPSCSATSSMIWGR